jgi:hypothetical protein
MERIAEIVQKVPACCLKDTLGLPSYAPENAARLAYGVAALRYFKRGVVNLLPAGSDDDRNTHLSKPLRWRCRCDGAASGVCRIPPDHPLFDLCYSLGAGSESDRLVDHRDEFCWLSLPSTRLFGRHSAKFPHDCRETKPTRAPATGSPICSIGDPSNGISADRSALLSPPTNRPSGPHLSRENPVKT